MTIQDVVQAAKNAGFTGESLVTAVAIAGAEGSYRPDAVGDNGNSFGPWQVYLPAHPNYTASQMLDLQQNANAAYQISGGGQTWTPWTMWKNGGYLAHVDEARAAVAASTSGGPVGDVPSQSASQISQILGFLNSQLGKPYVYGGSGPDSWDCSGLTLGAYSLLGIALPHDAAVQATMGTPVAVDPAAVQPGDLVFKFGDGVENGHVGIAVDSQTWIVAPHTGDVVKQAPIPWDQITAVRRFVTGPVSPGGKTGTFVSANPLDGVAAIGSGIGKTAAWISDTHNILRVVQVVAGVGAVFLGMRTIGAGTPAAIVANTVLKAPKTAAKAIT